MRKVEELFESTTNIGEVNVNRDDYLAHSALRDIARTHGLPVRNFAWPALTAATQPTGYEAVARRLAPGLANWLLRQAVNVVLSPEQLSAHPSHRIAGRAIMLAAMQAVIEANGEIVVLVAHGTTTIQGTWAAGITSETVPKTLGLVAESDNPILTPEYPAGVSYSRHLIRPGILMSGSVEEQFADQII